jgi:hypothetical protein
MLNRLVLKVPVPPTCTRSSASARSVDLKYPPRPCGPVVLFDYRDLGAAVLKGFAESVPACQLRYSKAVNKFDVLVFL